MVGFETYAYVIIFQAFNFEEELPEYDMDSEDDDWLKNFNKKKVRLLFSL